MIPKVLRVFNSVASSAHRDYLKPIRLVVAIVVVVLLGWFSAGFAQQTCCARQLACLNCPVHGRSGGILVVPWPSYVSDPGHSPKVGIPSLASIGCRVFLGYTSLANTPVAISAKSVLVKHADFENETAGCALLLAWGSNGWRRLSATNSLAVLASVVETVSGAAMTAKFSDWQRQAALAASFGVDHSCIVPQVNRPSSTV